MIDITHKISSHRSATAIAILLVSDIKTIDAINNKLIAKGDIFEFSRAAGLLAIKQTGHVIPDCHPLPIESAKITYEIIDLTIQITCEVQTIYRTGVEMESLHGASVAALTIFDMLKPIDKKLEITSIKLLSKKGGKSDFFDEEIKSIKTAVIVSSDSVSSGAKDDKAGKAIIDKLLKWKITTDHYKIIPDEPSILKSEIISLEQNGFDLVIVTGGTGLSKRDTTPETIKPLFTREIPGIMEAARNYGQERMPYAMLSRGVAGMINACLVVTTPGSTRGASETMDALFPYLLHIFSVQKGTNHEKKNK